MPNDESNGGTCSEIRTTMGESIAAHRQAHRAAFEARPEPTRDATAKRKETTLDQFDGIDELDEERFTCDECGNEFACRLHEHADIEVCDGCFEENHRICDHCGEVLDIDDVHGVGGTPYCEGCFDELFFNCARCDAATSRDDGFSVDDDLWCERCTDEHAGHCDNCGEYSTDYHSDDHGTTVCDRCWERGNYFTCDDCGNILSGDNAHSGDDEGIYCEGCVESHTRSHARGMNVRVYEYGDDPDGDWTFYHAGRSDPPETFAGDRSPRTSRVHYGPEIEWDDGGYRAFEKFDDGWPTDSFGDRFHFTEDSSLDDGFEAKSHPATLKYHLTEMPWGDLFALARRSGYKSHETDTCGVHVHISRVGFDNEEHLARFIWWFHRHWSVVWKFSRRKNHELGFCSKNNAIGESDETHDSLIDKMHRGNTSHHSCVSLSRCETVEVRVFKGTLRTTTLFAALEFCDALRLYTKEKTIDEIGTETWGDFKAWFTTKEYKFLGAYVESRGL